MKKKLENIAWVTGASEGIGCALIKQLAAAGWTVAATSRTGKKLSELAKQETSGAIHPFPGDITLTNKMEMLVAAIEKELGTIDLAILNAGTHIPITGKTFSVESVRELVETNLMGTVNCLNPVLKRFIQRRSGTIAVVSSLAGYRGLPTSAGYGATKAALINMCEALKPELDQFGVSLHLINPGFVKTPLTNKNTFPMPFLITADRAAREILTGLKRSKFEITFPFSFSVIMKFIRIIPDRLFFVFSRKLIGK